MPAIAPTPAAAAKLSTGRIAAALRRAGRCRGIDHAAAELKAALRKPQLRQPFLVETAMGKQALALLAGRLFNKLLVQLYHCLQRQQRFDEAKAFPLPPRNAAA